MLVGTPALVVLVRALGFGHREFCLFECRSLAMFGNILGLLQLDPVILGVLRRTFVPPFQTLPALTQALAAKQPMITSGLS